MRGWTKLGAHACSRTSALKTAIVFFSGKFGFSVLPSSLQSAIYGCPCTSRFLESVVTTRTTTTTLAYNTQRSFLPFSLSGAVSDNLLHRSTLRFTTHVGSGFCIIVGYRVLASNFERRGRDSVSAYAQVVSTSCLPLTSHT